MTFTLFNHSEKLPSTMLTMVNTASIVVTSLTEITGSSIMSVTITNDIYFLESVIDLAFILL